MVIDLQSVDRLDSSTWTLHILTTDRRRIRIHPAGKLLFYPRFIAMPRLELGVR